jgi:hypothetical protein
VKIGIANSRRIEVERKKDADKNGIGIKITGIARSLFIAGNKILNCQLSETVLNAMVMIGMIGQIDDFRTVIDVSLDRSEGERQSMIGWGAGLACMTGLVNVLVIFQETKRNLMKWQMHGFPLSLYSVEILILIGWSQGRLGINQCGRHSFPNGVQKG